jgi:hypothetical protein
LLASGCPKDRDQARATASFVTSTISTVRRSTSARTGLRSEAATCGAELPAVHDRHQQVEQDQVRPPAGVEHLERFAAIPGLAHLVAGLDQDLSEHASNGGLVLDDEDAAAHSPTAYGDFPPERRSLLCRLGPLACLPVRRPARAAGR